MRFASGENARSRTDFRESVAGSRSATHRLRLVGESSTLVCRRPVRRPSPSTSATITARRLARRPAASSGGSCRARENRDRVARVFPRLRRRVTTLGWGDGGPGRTCRTRQRSYRTGTGPYTAAVLSTFNGRRSARIVRRRRRFVSRSSRVVARVTRNIRSPTHNAHGTARHAQVDTHVVEIHAEPLVAGQ